MRAATASPSLLVVLAAVAGLDAQTLHAGSVRSELSIQALTGISPSPGKISINYQNGGANNQPSQSLVLSNSGDQPVTFSVLSAVDANPSGLDWLAVSPSSGTIPPSGSATLMVEYDATNALPPGTYTASVTVLPVGGPPAQDIPVTLLVSNAPLLNLLPGELHFFYGMGGEPPLSQAVMPSATNGAPGYDPYPQAGLTISASTTSGGGWLSAPTSQYSGSPFLVAVKPGGLAVGTYQGALTISVNGFDNSPQTLPVILTVANGTVVQTSFNWVSLACQIGHAPLLDYQPLDVTGNTGGPLNYAATWTASTCGPSWLTLEGATQGTNTGVLVSQANGSELPARPCLGTVTVSGADPATGLLSSVPILVTFYVSSDPLALVTPSAPLTFTAPAGSGASFSQYLAVSLTDGPAIYSVGGALNGDTPSIAPGWLAVGGPCDCPGPPEGPSIWVSSGQLPAGRYTGIAVMGAAYAANSAVIPVTLRLTAGEVSLSPVSLSFSQAWAGPPPAAQDIRVASDGPSITYGVSVSYSATFLSSAVPGNWLSASPSRSTATTAGDISVGVDGSKLPPGTYQGIVTVTAFGPGGTPIAGSPLEANVTLTVTPAIVATPASLTFTQIQGGAAPAPQTVQLASGSANLAFSVATKTSGGGTWLQATPASGAAPSALQVSVSAAGLTAGVYSGTIAISLPNGVAPVVVNVSLTVQAALAVVAIQNAASYAAGAISPGENIVILGTGLGPPDLAGPQLAASGGLATTVGDTQVLFGDTPAPIVYASGSQTSVLVPYEVAGQASSTLRVVYQGVSSAPVTCAVTATAPGIYTQSQSGSGAGVIVNEDGVTENGPAAPAARNSVVAAYLTGEGVTIPASPTGGIAPVDGSGLYKPAAPVTATVAGLPAQVEYYGSAPGLVYGIMLVNVRIPADAPSGGQPILIMVGNASTQAGVTVAVQ